MLIWSKQIFKFGDLKLRLNHLGPIAGPCNDAFGCWKMI